MTLRDLKLNTSLDLALDGADLAIVSDGTAVGQAVGVTLRTILGEWFLDQDTVGLPYLTEVMVKNPNPARLRTIFRDAILAVPGVKDITRLDLDLDRTTRTLSVDLSFTTDTGEFTQNIEVPL